MWNGDSLDMYGVWEAPAVIVSDGPYGLGMWEGDPRGVEGLAEFYGPHASWWGRRAGNHTTLWFWNTEVGWATVHPVLEGCGWRYAGCNVWNKGRGHIAGNVNTGTLRRFPTVTEVCVRYVREAAVRGVPAREWLRAEWVRAGLPLHAANGACGVANAASRKWLTADRMWYMPPPEAFGRLSAYANSYGEPGGRPYMSLDGMSPGTAEGWRMMRPRFRCPYGVTNVWDEPALRGAERAKAGGRAAHANQKPLRLMSRLLEASSDAGDMVWEPFGGLCTVSAAAGRLGRACRGAEIDGNVCAAAVARLEGEAWGG